MNAWEQNCSLQKQKQILEARASFMSRFHTKEERDRYDKDAFEDLKKVCPEKLVPSVFESDQHGQMVGFMIQKVGRGSHRVLVTLADWKILRIKKSATIRRVTDDPVFKSAVEVQRAAQDLVETLLLGNSKNGTRGLKNTSKHGSKAAV